MQQENDTAECNIQTASVDLDSIISAIGEERDQLKLRAVIVDIENGMMANVSAGVAGFVPGEAFPVRHDFADKLYARELFIPKGSVLTGRIHKFSHFNVVLRGDITVLTEFGITRYKAPCVIKSPAGIKRLGYAHEDTVWINMHGTEETDIETLEDVLTADTFEALGIEHTPVLQIGTGIGV